MKKYYLDESLIIEKINIEKLRRLGKKVTERKNSAETKIRSGKKLVDKGVYASKAKLYQAASSRAAQSAIRMYMQSRGDSS